MIDPNSLHYIPIVKPRTLYFEDDQPVTQRVDMCLCYDCQQWRGNVAYAPKLITNSNGFRICPKCNRSWGS